MSFTTGSGDCRPIRRITAGHGRTGDEGRQPEIPAHGRSHQQHNRRQHDSKRRQPSAQRQRRNVIDLGDLAIERAALRQPQRQIGRNNRDNRRQREDPQPVRQRRHLFAEHDEVGRIGNRQHEARRIGDEGANEEIRQRLDLGGAGRRIDRRRQHHGRGVVRQEYGDDGSHHIDDQEQPLRRTPRMPNRPCGEPVEQPFLSRDFGQQHHADEKEIDVRALAGGGKRVGPGQQVEQHQQRRPRDRPDELRQMPGTRDHAQRRERCNAPGCGVGLRRHRAPASAVAIRRLLE